MKTADVAIVGGGPAGTITGLLLARAGIEVVLFERAPAWRWRACGVFTSPASIKALRRVGLAEAELARVSRPVTAMRVETPGGTSFRLTYGGTGSLEDSAVGLDREAFDPLLLDRARVAGVDVHEGTGVARVELSGRRHPRAIATLHLAAGNGDSRERSVEARVVVGADGLRSVVASAAAVARRSPLGPRVALTFHVPDRSVAEIHDARMVVFRDGYVGLAPVPGGRLNVGIVLGRSWFAALRQNGGAAIARKILEGLPDGDGPPLDLGVLDRVAGVSPLGHRVSRRAGDGWLLVGDAAGFLDPFTGEGLHRAIVSAELAAGTIEAALDGGGPAKLIAYDRAMRARFSTKDLVSRVVQAFLGQASLFDYTARRLAARAAVRETMGLVIGDLEPPIRVLDPRYLAALLRP